MHSRRGRSRKSFCAGTPGSAGATVARTRAPPVRQGRPIALGSVSLWGRILVRENGFRAQYAYPYELHLIDGDEHIARELRHRYAVDVSRV